MKGKRPSKLFPAQTEIQSNRRSNSNFQLRSNRLKNLETTNRTGNSCKNGQERTIDIHRGDSDLTLQEELSYSKIALLSKLRFPAQTESHRVNPIDDPIQTFNRPKNLETKTEQEKGPKRPQERPVITRRTFAY